MAYVLSLYFWLLFITDSQMRSELFHFVFSWKTEYLLLDGVIFFFLFLLLFILLVGSIAIIVSPVSYEPNVRSVRQDVEFNILLMNLVAGIGMNLDSLSHERSAYHVCLTLVSIGVVLYEARLMLRDETAGEDTATGEMNFRHVHCCMLFALCVFLLSRYPVAPHWAESLSLACTAALLFGTVLPRALPLERLGYRLTHANWCMKQAYQGEVRRYLAKYLVPPNED